MWIIRDIRGGGYAANIPMEGWIWTVLRPHATRFDTKESAYKIAMRFYSRDAFSIEKY